MNEMTYYLLPVSQQKDLAYSLERMQKGVTFSVGPLQPLNYEMATLVIFIFNFLFFGLFLFRYQFFFQLTNKIYTFLMVLLTFV